MVEDAKPAQARDRTANSRKSRERQSKRDDGLRPIEVWVTADSPEAVAMVREAERLAVEKYPPTPRKPVERD